MPTIKLTDQFGLDVDVQPAAASALLKYFQQVPSLKLENADISKISGLTLDEPAITSFSTGISFQSSVPVGGGGAPDFSIQAGAHGSFALTRRTPATPYIPGLYAVDMEIPEDTCYVSFTINASMGTGAAAGAGLLQFGVTPGTAIAIGNYRPFPLKSGVTLLDALRQTIAGFQIPARVEDLATLPQGCVAAVTGAGSLRLSVTANLLALANPLASVSLPAPLPAPLVSAGGSVQVGATYELGCEYQICASGLGAGRVRLGWYRKQSTEISVRATVKEGVTAGFGSTDLFSLIVGAISANPAVDQKEMEQAGLPELQIEAIRDVVQSAAARKLELSLSAEIGAMQSGAAAFLYEIDLAALTQESRDALEHALRGDLSGLHSGALPGINCVQSVWQRVQARTVKLNVNLLGILNFGSIATLARSGTVLFEPATGALVITDQSTASRIQTTQVNFGADSQKLRHVMAESFLLTAVYHGTHRTLGGPSLHCSHCFFDLENSTSPEHMRRKLRIGAALGLFSMADAEPPGGILDFGRTVVDASAEYHDGLSTALFLDHDGAPLAHEFYEQMGRNAIQLLVSDADQDAARRRPAIDNDLWARMKDQGQANFAALFPNLPAPLLGAITADYSTIVWWADAMAGAADRLAVLRQWFNRNPAASLDDPVFQKMREEVAKHLRNVAATTREEFGEPWGLIAMNEAGNRCAGASILIAGPMLVRQKERPLTNAASPAG